MYEFLRLIIPQKAEIFVFTSVSLLLLLLQNIKRFLMLLNSEAVSTVSNTQSTDNIFASHLKSIENRVDPRIVDLVLWVLIGCIAFVVISFAVAAIKSADDEVELIHYYRFPNGRNHEINAFLTKVAVRVAGGIGFVLWLTMFLKTINPGLTKLFFTSVATPKEPSSWLWVILSIVFYSACLYVFVIFTRLILLKVRVFGRESE